MRCRCIDTELNDCIIIYGLRSLILKHIIYKRNFIVRRLLGGRNSLISLTQFGEVKNYCYRIEAMATMKRRHPDGIAIEAEQIINNCNGSLGDTTSSESMDHLFITMVRSLRNLSFPHWLSFSRHLSHHHTNTFPLAVLLCSSWLCATTILLEMCSS